MSIKFLFIDTETTGIDSIKHGIWQIAGHVIIDGELKEKFNFECSPFVTDEYEEMAVKMSGKTEQELKSLELPFITYNKFINLLFKYVNKFDKQDKFFFVGYNANFDMQMLRQWFIKNNDKYFGSWFWFPPLDVMGLAAWNLIGSRTEMSDFKLGTVCKQLGVIVDESKLHEADTDIQATFDLAQKMLFSAECIRPIR